MPGERWPDKRARAVLFAGARKQQDGAADDAADEAERIAETGLAVRELVFTDGEVREDNADVKAHRIGYSADCMQFATLEPTADGVALGLWLGAEAAEAESTLSAARDPNPFRAHFGWVRVTLRPGDDVERLGVWVERARRHAAAEKGTQAKGL